MRDLKRNQKVFYYALYEGYEDVEDTDGNKTGEKRISYGDPIKMYANISPASGYANVAIFGKDVQYNKTIVTCEMNCPINETSVLWIDKDPYDGNNNVTPYDYTVSQVARGLNNIVYAVNKVEMRNG
jgi:hypothetical protein